MATVRLTWTDANSGAAQEDEIRIYRATSAFDATTLPAVLATLPADTLTYDDTTAVDGLSYWYAVAAEKNDVLAISFTGEVEVVGGAPLASFTVAIGAGEVASTLTDFPVMVDLSLMPSGFSTNVRADGGNIRARASAGGAQYPLDIAVINKIAQTGTLWVKVPSITAAGGANFILELGASTQTREARDATYGSQAVWSAYKSVFLGGENTDDRASTTRVFPATTDVVTFLNVGNPEMTFAADPHQGITWHEASGEVYTSDNNVLRRYDASGSLLTSNTNPSGDVETLLGMATLGHACDLCVVNDWLIVPINNYPSDTLCALAVFDRTTLALVAATNVTATQDDISGVCWNPELQRLVTCNWNTFTALRKFALDLSTGAIAADGSISLTLSSGNMTDAAQGIEWWRGHYWITDDTRSEVLRVKPDGTADINDCPIQYSDSNSTSVSGNYEGICVYKDGLAVLVDPSSANSYMIYARPANHDFGGGGAKYGGNNSYFEATGLTGTTTFTMAVSAKRSAGQQSALASFRDFSSGATNDRVTLVHRLVSGNYPIQLWDNINTWLTPGSPVNSTTSAFNRVACVYNGTNRELYIDGVSKATQSGITARDAGFTAFTVGGDDTTNNENFDGDIAFAYIYPGVLSADWLAAEHSMVSNPGGFYTIT